MQQHNRLLTVTQNSHQLKWEDPTEHQENPSPHEDSPEVELREVVHPLPQMAWDDFE